MINTSNYNNILSILSSIQQQSKKEDTILNILKLSSEIANCDGYFLYNLTPTKYINLEYINIKSLHINITGGLCDKIYPPIYIPNIKNKKLKNPIELCATSKEIINTPNIHNEILIDTSYIKKFDLENNYNTVSMLAFPLFNSSENVISIIQFINAKTPSGQAIPFSHDIQKNIIAICQLISVLQEREQSSEIYNKFLTSFASILTKITKFKTPHIASYNNHISFITQRLAIALSSADEKAFKNFEMSTSEWNILNLTSLLYDCGKIMIPDYILNKTTKLETTYNRINEIRQRFEILRRDAHIEYLQKRLNNISDKETLQAEFVEKVKQLHDDFEFIGKCNTDVSELKKEDIIRLEKIANKTYTRHFNRTTGLSSIELKNINTQTASQTEIEHLIQDLPEQTSNIYDKGELSNLKTKSGIINPSEQAKIKEYFLNTSNLLSDFPFSYEYSNIHEIIITYEKILKNTTPLPKDNSKNTILAKIISLATIFTSLISKETPCAKNKKLSEIMKIMQKMRNEGKIDTDLYNIFIKNNIYIDFAKEYLETSQIDEINIEDII